MRESTTILIVAGEASGDAHAADLMRELHALRPGIRFFGMGGPAMGAQGLEALFDAREISVMGFAEVLPKLARIHSVLRALARAAEERRPALAILVDVPDFNLRLARRLRQAGIPVVYYISPMVWAWRPGRVRTIAERVDRMLCILPFEVEHYQGHGVDARYVGNPVLDQVPDPAPARVFQQRLGLPPLERALAILPGSRESEVARVLPAQVGAARLLRSRDPALSVIVPVAPGLQASTVRAHFAGSGIEPHLVAGRAAEAVGASDAALVCSGTAVLEAGLMERPLVVVYRAAPLTMALWRALKRVEHVSLVNLLAGRAVVPELLQERFTPESAAAALAPLLRPGEARESMIRELRAVRERLGPRGASARAAAAVAGALDELGKGAPAASARPDPNP